MVVGGEFKKGSIIESCILPAQDFDRLMRDNVIEPWPKLIAEMNDEPPPPEFTPAIPSTKYESDFKIKSKKDIQRISLNVLETGNLEELKRCEAKEKSRNIPRKWVLDGLHKIYLDYVKRK